VCGCSNQGTGRRTAPHPVGVAEFKVNDRVAKEVIGGLEERQTGSQCPNRSSSLPAPSCTSSLLCNSSDPTQTCTNCTTCPTNPPLNCGYLWGCSSAQAALNPACTCPGFTNSGWSSSTCGLGAAPTPCSACSPTTEGAPCPIPWNPEEGCKPCYSFIGAGEDSNCPTATNQYPCLQCHLMNYYNNVTQTTSLICASHLAPAQTQCYCAAYPNCGTACNSGLNANIIGMNRICAPWNSASVVTMQCLAGCVGALCALASVNDCNQGVAIPAGSLLPNGSAICSGAYSCGGTICATPVTQSGTCGSNSGSYSQSSQPTQTSSMRQAFKDGKIDPTTGESHQGIPIQSNI